MSSIERPRPQSRSHLRALHHALRALEDELPRLERWGDRLADVLLDGGRLLVAGNGGSAAEAQHLTAELVGRYRDERRPLSAISLHADTSSLTAIGNDYGADECFARQVRAHGREGDILLALSTSGESANVIAAAEAACELDMSAWALTGPGPSSLGAACGEVVRIDAASTATVQEAHLVAIHLLCAGVDERVASASAVPALAHFERAALR
ncbi:MAG TPA: SIS domain-containing protein [Thermoleophilaceae bacterium]|nr:SIS domain-containing protein [Thermoleophilaceae bacterium]